MGLCNVSMSAHNSVRNGLPDTRRDCTSRPCVPCATVAVPRGSSTHFYSLLWSSCAFHRYRCAGRDDIAGIGPIKHTSSICDYVNAKSGHLVCCSIRRNVDVIRPLTGASLSSVFDAFCRLERSNVVIARCFACLVPGGAFGLRCV